MIWTLYDAKLSTSHNIGMPYPYTKATPMKHALNFHGGKNMRQFGSGLSRFPFRKIGILAEAKRYEACGLIECTQARGAVSWKGALGHSLGFADADLFTTTKLPHSETTTTDPINCE